MYKFIIATRRSPLALWQANWVKSQLQSYYPDWNIELLPLTTQGDQTSTMPLSDRGGKGLFLKELQQAVLEKRAHIAVHSMKDVSVTFSPDNLVITAICEREDPSDALVSLEYARLVDLPPHAIIGTSSVRRTAQLLAWRSDLIIRPLRGNVDTRLNKIKTKEYDAILLATAGLVRLGKTSFIRERLSVSNFIPAVGQGALGIECRQDDLSTQKEMAILNHLPTGQCVFAERAFSACLEGDCGTPLAAYAVNVDEQWHIRGMVGSEDGQRIICGERKAKSNPVQLGKELAEDLLNRGAGELLKKELSK